MAGGIARRFRVAAPQVVGDVVDGEAIVVDLGSGRYHRLVGAGALVWQAVAEGRTPPTTGPVGGLVAALLEAGLIVPESDAGDRAVVAGAADAGAADWPAIEDDGRLALESFDDLADMLLLDPIHEVDPDAGWPTPVRPA